ncbi:MAG: endonuclease/exonuclease/phosphatase family protein [Deltaproteobacteria bacterium]|nr:endonuclease/exonuclease/phosphatase family protein [Deltaproteobacteria bacterium]
MRKLRVLSYNIHKGFNATNFDLVLKGIKESIELVHADLVLLQEVVGHHEHHGKKHKDWPTVSQFEYLADKLWPHHAYGKNAVYTEGHHGNAILSKYPITFSENVNVSTNALEQRGMLHARLKIPGASAELHVFCLHLSLFSSGRRAQLGKLCDRIERLVPHDAPLVVGGDFNDWQEIASPILARKLTLEEAFLKQDGRHAKSFPAWLPVLRLDRIYFRWLEFVTAKIHVDGVWSRLSDHAAVEADFRL